MVKTDVILGGSEFLLEQALPRIERKVSGSFLLHLRIWLGCYDNQWHYGLNLELMWVLSQIIQQIIIYIIV
jgi:hypothetical protein